jgi:hypothetical protein
MDILASPPIDNGLTSKTVATGATLYSSMFKYGFSGQRHTGHAILAVSSLNVTGNENFHLYLEQYWGQNIQWGTAIRIEGSSSVYVSKTTANVSEINLYNNSSFVPALGYRIKYDNQGASTHTIKMLIVMK